ncbi:MAG TPA: hypothetical protein VHX38_15180 [Pseudonocardiaceae bacterium]|nr:hypothetical protein [Pseudonocardiaceae bacterium]
MTEIEEIITAVTMAYEDNRATLNELEGRFGGLITREIGILVGRLREFEWQINNALEGK